MPKRPAKATKKRPVRSGYSSNTSGPSRLNFKRPPRREIRLIPRDSTGLFREDVVLNPSRIQDRRNLRMLPLGETMVRSPRKRSAAWQRRTKNKPKYPR